MHKIVVLSFQAKFFSLVEVIISNLISLLK